MTKTEYAELLKGERWQTLRKEFLSERLCCERCELPRWLAAIAYDQDLHAHHKSYARIGTAEEVNDLEALCRRCHDIETFGTTNLRAPINRVCACGALYWDPREAFCSDCLLVFSLGKKSVYDYMLGTTPWGESVWKDLLGTIRWRVSEDEVLDELSRISEIMRQRDERFKNYVTISDEDIPF
jgi:hypothetical protein